MNYLMLIIILIFSSLISKGNEPKKEKYQPPRLTVIIVVDQGAYFYLPKLKDYLQGGIKKMMTNSVFYKKAYFPHGIPETTPGHHTLSTATLPKDHGAITNQWIDPETYEKIAYEDIMVPVEQKMIMQESPQRTMVDGLSDQFMLNPQQYKKHKAFAFSIKDYPAISMAHKLGKAFWFDNKTGKLRSSGHYFTQLPDWAQKISAQSYLSSPNSFSWNLAYQDNHAAYDFPEINNHRYAGYPFTMAESKNIPIDQKKSTPYDLFMKSPHASQMMFDAARSCLEHEFDDDTSMLLWISLSNLDLAGHIYGPDSKELIDLFYHIDQQIDEFFHTLMQFVKPSELLITLTADHGIAPIPELAHVRGYTKARRIIADELIKKLNKKMIKKFKLPAQSQTIMKYQPSSFTLNKTLLGAKKKSEREAMEQYLCDLLKLEPGIKNAWRFDELNTLPFEEHSLEQFYKNQLYFGRSGDIIIQPAPYCLLTNYPTGTSHMTPYEYDTHVPLMLYRKGKVSHKIVEDKVYLPQLPISLARLLNVPLPSASTYDPLPGIAYDKML